MTAAPRDACSILTLNVSHPPHERAAALLEYLWHHEEQVWVLTETGGARSRGTELMTAVARAAGYQVLASEAPAGEYGVMVVGTGAVLLREAGPRPAVMPWRVTTARVEPAIGEPYRLAAVYGAASDPVRYSSSVQRERKREWLRSFLAFVEEWLADDDTPAAVVGDLNIAVPVTAAAPRELKYVLAEELAAYRTLTTTLGLVDVITGSEPTWVDHTGVGCRYDHVLVTPHLGESSSVIDHTPRELGLTDHSCLTAEFGGTVHAPVRKD